MNHAPLMAVIDGVVARFQLSGLPEALDVEDLRHHCFLKTLGTWKGGASTALVAASCSNHILKQINKARREERNIEKFTADYLSGLSSKSYTAKKRIIDPWRILSLDKLQERDERWGARRSRITEGMETATARVRAELAETCIGAGYWSEVAA